jgi:hypothetical protein
MKRPVSASLITVAVALLSGGGFAADLFDSPGPGYREQRDQLRAVPVQRSVLPKVQTHTKIGVSTLADPFGKETSAPIGTANPFSEPIRLFSPTPVPPAKRSGD